MKKTLCIIFSVLCYSCYAQTATNPRYNLDLEELNAETGLPVNWGLGNVMDAKIPKDNSLKAYSIDTAIRQHGKRSLMINWSTEDKEWTATNYVINRSFKGKRIKLTGYIKTDNIAGMGAGLWMRLDGEGHSMEGFDNMMDRAVKGTTDWKEYTIELSYNGEDVKSIVVGGIITGKGKMWMDNLHVSIDGKDITEAAEFVPLAKYNAEKDSAFNKGSGIATIMLTPEKVQQFTNLGMLWGFMKYYHAGVARGEYDMDAALFRILPKIMGAANTREANALMEQWVDGFGKPDACKKCSEPEASLVKLKPDYGHLFTDNNLPGTLTAKLEYIKKNRANEEHTFYVEAARWVGNPIFKHELAYSNNAYPDAGVRLLALYRYWNMVQYFFPDRHLIGEDWNKVLAEFIPEFCNARDSLEYQLACLKLIARIHDTHANIWGGGTELTKYKGSLQIPCSAAFIEEKLVVTGYYVKNEDITTLHIGDVIEKIDGKPVDELVKKYLPLTAASNYETQLRDMPRHFLMRGNVPDAKLTVNRDGETKEIIVQRIPFEKISRDYTEPQGYKLLNDSIGYIFPGVLKENDLDKIETLFEHTKGFVIDMRCYPSVFMAFSYGKWLKPESSPFVLFTGGMPDYPGYFTTNKGTTKNGNKNKNYYKGKIVIIVNAETQSSAEYQTMALSTAPKVTVIGSTTAGADGNVSKIILPGGLSTMFSGIGILYPDGTETQRKGVKIDKVVKPTIKGIKEGRDELLEEAIRIISRPSKSQFEFGQ